MLKMINLNKKHKKNRLMLLLMTAIFSLTFMTNPVHAAAAGFAKENFALKFGFPENIILAEVSSSSNVIKYVEEKSYTSISISEADLYYTVTNDGDKALVKKYPKKELWIGCGLFNKTWNDKDYVLDYLSKAVNGNNTQYICTIDNIELAGLPFYKFTYMQQENNDQMPGGVIYLTLYQSTLYIVQYFDYKYASVAPYTAAFESTLQIEGIDQYSFRRFGLNSYMIIIIIVIILAAVIGGLLAYKFKKGSKRGY